MVLLAMTYGDKRSSPDPKGWICSEKLDGVRMIYRDGACWTRTGHSIAIPPSFREELDRLPKGLAILDGELWGGRGTFSKVSGVARRHNPSEGDWEGLQYVLFDCPSLPGPFKERIAALRGIIPEGGRIKVVDTWVVRDRDSLLEDCAKYEAGGAEGLMIRDPGSYYEAKRSKTLLKVKPHYDAEAVVVGTTEGKGRLEGGVGSFQVRSLPPSGDAGREVAVREGLEFSVGVKAKEYGEIPVGATIVYKYWGLTNTGKPRLPILLKVL